MKTIVEKRVYKEAEKLPKCVQELAAKQILSLTHRKDSYKKHNLPWRK